MQGSQGRRVLTQGHISGTGHGALPHRRHLQHVCRMGKLLPPQTCTGFCPCPDFLPILGHKCSLCFRGCFLEYVLSTPGHLPPLSPLQADLLLILGSKRTLPPTVASGYSGTSCPAATLGCNLSQLWLPSVPPGKFFFLKLVLSTRLHARVVVAWLQTPSLPTFSEKAKQNRYAVERLLEPTAHWFLRNFPGHSCRAELPGQGGTEPELRTEGEKALGEWKK